MTTTTQTYQKSKGFLFAVRDNYGDIHEYFTHGDNVYRANIKATVFCDGVRVQSRWEAFNTDYHLNLLKTQVQKFIVEI